MLVRQERMYPEEWEMEKTFGGTKGQESKIFLGDDNHEGDFKRRRGEAGQMW
jgi:hypothetical protein